MTKKNHIVRHAELDSASTKNKALHSTGFRIKSGMTQSGEVGRSMVEMLGVLAIIGVLSVAGIAGYSIAMRNYRANEIVNAASMFYVLAKAQNQGNGPTENISYENVGGTNPSGATLTYTDNAFTITFDDTDDCTMAANKLGDKATADCATNKKLTVNFGEVVNTPSTPIGTPNNSSTAGYYKCQSLSDVGYYGTTDSSELVSTTACSNGCYCSESENKYFSSQEAAVAECCSDDA